MVNDIFRLDQPLPAPGSTTVLEASAGTGKTYTIAALAARYVAEGLALDQLLAVTFSRRATSELRDAIRNRLIVSHQGLTHWLANGSLNEPDQVNQLLVDADPELIATRCSRLATAIGQVDTAPIFTLHTFASRMLTELGLLADHDPVTELGTDLDLLADEVIADVYLSSERWQRLGWAYARELGRQATSHLSEQLYPPDTSAELRASFAQAVRDTYDQRKYQRRQLDYDDMIMRLAATLTDPQTGADAAETLSQRFRVVLVDEFQDTDPAQWEFLRAGFAGRATMMLIGDPKQAIYRFRGGDIETYTQARQQAATVQRLATNHRSDAGVVRGIENLFGPIDLGSAPVSIQLRQVHPARQQPRIRWQDSAEPKEVVRVRALNSAELLQASTARQLIATDLVAQVNLLLSGDYEWDDPRSGWRRVHAGDIAVLVSTNQVGRQIHQQLTRAGHSSVFTGELSVFASPAAADWLVVLEALESPDRWHQRRAMMTELIGWTSADIADAGGDDLVEMTALLTRCSRLLATQGIAAVFETLVAERRLYPRLLAQPGGEALVADLRHLAQLLNQAQSTQRLSVSALTAQLRQNIERAPLAGDERARRLPTDRPAIRVLTVHQAKGLQFPIVLLPQAADKYLFDPDNDVPLIGHRDGIRVLDVAEPRHRSERAASYQAEELAESLRGFYVACTRAQSLLICWWAATQRNTTSSPLHRLLMNDTWQTAPQPSYLVGPAINLPTRPTVATTIVEAAVIESSIPPQTATRLTQPARLLDARHFSDHIDRAWTRTSYSGLTSADHQHGPALVDDPGGDEPSLEEPDLGQLATANNNSALAELPGGTQFGSLVHEILEQVDPASSDLNEALRNTIDELVGRYPLAGLDTDALALGLFQSLTTPLGVLTGQRSLRDLGAANRLAELDFELPLGAATRRGRVGDLAQLFDALPADDPLQRYGQQLAASSAAGSVLAGFLTGSIDAVLQIPEEPRRYVVVDYKTNRLPNFGPAAMTSAMCEAHYPLQALLYSVGLHRYLGWRLPGYDPQRHLGGVGYLFVRGLSGPNTPILGTMPSGVFTWRPPAELILAASEILAGGHRQ